MRGEGVEPSPPIQGRDFNSLVSAIPPPALKIIKSGGGTGIRTQDTGFAIRCLSPLGHAALLCILITLDANLCYFTMQV